MSEQDNVQIVRQIYAALNDHDLNRTRPFYGEGYTYMAPGRSGPMNADEGQAHTQNILNAFPDTHFDIREIIADGDYVVANWTATATNTGPLTLPSGDQIPATHRKGMIYGSSTFRFKDGKIIASHAYWDMASMLIQIGIMSMGQMESSTTE